MLLRKKIGWKNLKTSYRKDMFCLIAKVDHSANKFVRTGKLYNNIVVLIYTNSKSLVYLYRTLSLMEVTTDGAMRVATCPLVGKIFQTVNCSFNTTLKSCVRYF